MKKIINDFLACKDMQKSSRAFTLIAHALKQHMSLEEINVLRSKINKVLIGEHYDSKTALKRIERMFYISKDGDVIQAPFVTQQECYELYGKCKMHIQDYNFYDYMVVLNETIANYHNLLRNW